MNDRCVECSCAFSRDKVERVIAGNHGVFRDLCLFSSGHIVFVSCSAPLDTRRLAFKGTDSVV